MKLPDTPLHAPWAYAQEAGRLALRYAATTVAAHRQSALFDGVETYGMFVGYPRSGHSLVGSLLDAHPEAVVAHEAAALKHVHARFDRDRLFAVLLANSTRYGADGRVSGTYAYDVPGQWQGRFRQLRVIADKQGEGTGLRLRARPWLLDRLRRTVGVPLRIVHGVRNPYDNVATMARRAAEASRHPLDLDDAIHRYSALCETAARVRQQTIDGEWIDLRHEDLVADPVPELRALCRAVGLDAPEDYLAACAEIVRSRPHQSRYEVTWTGAQRESVARLIDRFETLRPYSFED